MTEVPKKHEPSKETASAPSDEEIQLNLFATGCAGKPQSKEVEKIE